MPPDLRRRSILIMKGSTMISPHVLRKIRRIYSDCLNCDDFESRNPDEQINESMYGSMRSLLQDLCRLAANPSNPEGLRLKPLDNLDMTVEELMALQYVQRDGKTMRLGAVVFSQFCRHRVDVVLDELFRQSSARELLDQPLAVNANPPQSLDELRHQLDEPEAQQEIGLVLMADLQQAWNGRTLRSFFMAKPNAQGFMAWWPEARLGSGTPIPTEAIPTRSGTVVNMLTRCDGDEEDGVTPYEWCAELRLEANSPWPDAVAYGMAYVFERDDEAFPVGGAEDLICAAHAVSDVDAQQVDALLHQHPDMDELIARSDIAFVWLWERRLGTARGLGAECLQAALQDLASRFPHLHTVVVNMKPSQFNDWGEGIDPPGIVIAKQDAIDALHAHVGELRLDDIVHGEVRMIVANRDPDPEELAQEAARAEAKRLMGKTVRRC
jgi:hypothetical protein